MGFIKSIFVLLILMACTKNIDTPEGLLDYVIKAVVKGEDVTEYFLNNDNNQLSEGLENLRDVKLKVLNKNCPTDNSCKLTYVISYDSLAGEKKSANVEAKKIADLIKIDEKWKISSVLEVKTYIESNSEIRVE